MRTQTITATVMGVALSAGSASAITPGQVDDFQDGTTQNWVASGANPNPPAHAPSAGPAGFGDDALVITTNGQFTGAGSRLAGRNLTQWAGDYTAAGVTDISVDLRNPNDVALNVRLALRSPNGDFVTPDVVLAAGTGVWDNFTFSLDAGSLIPVGAPGDAGLALASVTELRLLHNPDANFRGATVGTPTFAAQLLADNITALPLALLVGDYNSDGFVSQGDLDLVLLNWGDAVAPAGFDEDAIPGGGPFDGLVSQNELDGVLLNWGDGTPPVTAVPEPATAVMLCLGGAALLRRRAN